ncbi:ABC transporter substrate-binding protein [Longimicrobium sp.]|uniref:ABC transporter substrate-binding protein n=1 Tax=Longimicrobium sp. TaxID=2029185 RepID=UPI002C8F2812|nr:ABC transporter substrate-binding protein [Longimicrobium sp.]HSU12521.1 ABC transporter substrate-binding protein [Longimicrobium sp.]
MTDHPAPRVLRRGCRAAALVAVSIAVAATAACSDSTGADNREVVLGGVFSLTGNWASLGVTSKAAMELAVEDVNAYTAGRGITFRADVRDTKLDPATALAAVQSLRESGVQVVIGPQSSAELATLKPYVDANPVIVVSQSSTAGTLAVKNDRIFRFTPADSLEGVAASALMWSDGIRAVVPIWRGDAGNQGLHTATAARMAAQGATVSAGVEYAANATSYTATVAALAMQVQQALATHPAGQVAVYYAGFDETADVFALAAANPALASVRWYGADGIAQTSPLLARPAAVAFAEQVGFPAPLFGLDPSAAEKWQPLAARIKARSGTDPDAFALAVYDAVWVAAQAYLASPRSVSIDELSARFVATAGSFYGATGWTVLNPAGDRQYADFDFWAVRPAGSGHAWTRVASYDTRLGTLTRY